MKLFLDSSALVKRYVEETGSVRVRDLCREAGEIALSILCTTEVLSACNRLVRDSLLTRDQYAWIKNEFLLDLEEVLIIDITGDVVMRSVRCLELGALRSLDALHIASALEFSCDLFVTSDSRQKDIAVVTGLKVELV